MEEWIDIAKKVDLSDTNLTTEDLKGKDLDNFDHLIKILCLFKLEWYNHIFRADGGLENNPAKGSAQGELLVSRFLQSKEKAAKQLKFFLTAKRNLQIWALMSQIKMQVHTINSGLMA